VERVALLWWAPGGT